MPIFFRILLLVLLLPVMLFSQHGPDLTMSETSSFRMEDFTMDGALLNNPVNCITQGPNGFLWFGTHLGLFRYDGHATIRYPRSDEESLENNFKLTFSYIENLFWDSYDRLWVCTYGGGLFEFDPKTEQFTHFGHDPQDSTTISHDRVLCAAEDAEGRMWFGTENGLNQLDRHTQSFSRYFSNPFDTSSLSHSNVRNIYLDKMGTLWIATGVVFWAPEEGGLNRYNPAHNSFTRFMHDQSDSTSLWTNAVQGLLEDNQGNFWVTTTGGLQKMDRTKGTFSRMHFHSSLPHAPGAGRREMPAAYALLEDQRGGLWVGTIGDYEYPSHLLRYDPYTHSVENFPLQSAAWHLCESEDGTVWVAGAGEGSGQVQKISSKEKTYDLQKGTQIFADFKNSLLCKSLRGPHIKDQWLGPLSMTFDRDDGSMWIEYIFDSWGAEGYKPYPILVNHDQRNGTNDFYHLDNVDLSALSRGALQGNTNVDWLSMGMAMSADGKIWGSYPSDRVGVYCFDPLTGEVHNFQHEPQEDSSLASNQVVYLLMDRAGMIWVALYHQGLSKLDPATGKWSRVSLTGMDSDGDGMHFFPTVIYEDRDGLIWTGGKTEKNKPFVASIDAASGKYVFHPLPKGITLHNFPRFFAQVGDTILYSLHTQGIASLAYKDTSAFPNHFFGPKNSFPISDVAALVGDQLGNTWIASREDNLFSCLDLRTTRWITFRNNSAEPTIDQGGLLGPDGNIYFIQHNQGWSEINPKTISAKPINARTLILTELMLNDKNQIPTGSEGISSPIWEMDQLDIPHDVHSFAFRFSCFAFHSPQVLYEYRLYPYEHAWSTPSDDPLVRYQNIPIGSYQFQVRGWTAQGQMNTERAHLRIDVLPPWWQTWWAYCLLAAVLLFVIARLYRYQHRQWQLQTKWQVERERTMRLEELDQFKTRFYTNITHEFRTPLTAIRGMSDQIRGQENIKNLIRRNTDRILTMVNQMLDLSKLESNNLTIHWVQRDIIPYLQYLTESCHSLAVNRNINLAFFSKEDHIKMDFDENKMQQILINLISNAIKFTPEYGSVKVISSRIFENNHPMLELIVQDTGKGIPKHELPHIFDRFYQVEASGLHSGAQSLNTRTDEGSGIGLALAKELVHLLKGRIEVESEVKKGSSFKVYLPIHQEAPLDVATHQSAPVEPSLIRENQPAVPADAEKETILIIEDNADVSEYIQSCLMDRYQLYTAYDGEEGLRKAFEWVPDMILCDVMMPKMDGFDVCKRLKTDQRTSHIPVILLTAKATQQDKNIGLDRGADAYLTKPFDQEELLLRISNLTQLRKQLQERLSHGDLADNQSENLEHREVAFLHQLNQIIDAHLDDELFDTLRLCRAMTMSRTQLHRKIKALTGIPTAGYIRSIRLKKAKKLLQTSTLPIGEIAIAVGYKDFSHFSRSFIKEFGVKPSSVRH